jgi:hypothetical protein
MKLERILGLTTEHPNALFLVCQIDNAILNSLNSYSYYSSLLPPVGGGVLRKADPQGWIWVLMFTKKNKAPTYFWEGPSPVHPRSNTGKYDNSQAPASSAIGIGASPSTVLSCAVCKKDQYSISFMVSQEAILYLVTPRSRQYCLY